MAGRPPNPTALQLLTGAGRKNPKRMKARAGEPVPPDRKIQPPEEWTDFRPLQDEASRLIAEGKSLNEIAAELNVSWDEADVLKRRNPAYLQANKLLNIWHKRLIMWPWTTFSDTDALAHYCELKLKQESGTLSGAELTAIRSIRSELGGTGSGRARLGVRPAGGAAPQKPKGADPRAQFLARKTG
jgi:DNA-binding CsgD family transcriptional regulator